jgi:hypothetical protein
MVRPEWVVEISCLDLIAETTRGGTINRMVLEWTEAGYRVVRRMPLAAVISPQFIRRREDKSVRQDDVRIQQLTDRVEIPLAGRDVRQMALPKSEILRREVYAKQSRGATMVRKFVLWKTNKETDSDDYPAYVVHYTDFSPNRKAPLARDIRVSNSEDQIQALYEELKADNIKKGWELVTDDASAAVAEEPAAAQPTTAPPKPARAKPETGSDDVKKPPRKAAAKKKATKMAPSERTPSKKKTASRKKTG